MITNEISDDYEKRMNSMMKTVMIVGEGLGLGVQQMIHLILAPFSPHAVTIFSLTFLSDPGPIIVYPSQWLTH